MKKYLLLSTIMFACIQNIQSQTIVRLMDLHRMDGSGLLTDSSHYTYSGNRGGDETQNNEPKYDNLYRYKYQSGTWNNYQRQNQTYNVVDYPVQTLTERYVNGTWRNYDKYDYIFDASDSTLGYEAQGWDTVNNIWKGYYASYVAYDAQYNMILRTSKNFNQGLGYTWDSKDSMTYDISNRLKDKYYSTWNGTDWDKIFFIHYTYDAAGDMIIEKWQKWNNATWNDYSVDSNSYDNNHNLLVNSSMDFDAGIWETGLRYTFTYDSNHNKLTSVTELPDATHTSHVFSQRATYTYDANNRTLSLIYEQYISGAWVNSNKQERTWSNGKNILTVNSQWINGAWEGTNKFESTLDANNQVQYQFSYGYQSGGWVLQNSSQNWFQLVTGVNDINHDIVTSVYPNPFRKQLNMRITTTSAGNAQLFLYNAEGKLVNVKNTIVSAGENIITMNTYNLPKGNYFYEVNLRDGKSTGKVVVE